MSTLESLDTELKYSGNASVKFPLSTFDTAILFRRIEIRQDIHEHDLAIIRARSRFLRWEETLFPGSPVRIRYSGKRTSEDTFYGYVTHVKPITKLHDDNYEVDIYCIASSRDLRRTDQNVWRNKTGPEIASDIARRFNLKIVTRQHPFRKPQTIQSGETYWEFLTRLAKTIGYALRVEGGHLLFLPMTDMVAAHVSLAPRLSNFETKTDSGVVLPRNLTSMSMWGSDTDTDVDRVSDDSVVVSMSPTGGAGEKSRRGPRSSVARRRRNSRYQKYKTGVVAHRRKDAEILAQSDAAAGSMAIDAEARAEGDGYLKPYRPVFVSTRDKSTNGWWLVKSAVHVIDLAEATYHCDLVLSTDSIEPSRLPSNPRRRFRNLQEEQRLGWSPLTLTKPRLRKTKSGFVRGQTKHNKNSARWVGF